VYRIGVGVIGGAVIVAGVAMLVLPGPGWLAIFLGLGILSTEFAWAHRLLNWAKNRVHQATDKVKKRTRRKKD